MFRYVSQTRQLTKINYARTKYERYANKYNKYKTGN